MTRTTTIAGRAIAAAGGGGGMAWADVHADLGTTSVERRDR